MTLVYILLAVIAFILWKIYKNSDNNKNIIYVLDRLLQIAIDGEAINETRKIDLPLYQILNSSKVNQEIVHLGVLPIVRENKRATDEFVHFINNLCIYMEYDINTDFLWAKTTNNPSAQKNLYEKITATRKEILNYLLDKKLISVEQHSTALEYKVKDLA